MRHVFSWLGVLRQYARLRLALALMLVAVLPTGTAIWHARSYHFPGKIDYVAWRAPRLEAARRTLPSGLKEVGYLGLSDHGSVRNALLLAVAQYQLAPVRVVDSTEPEWILGDFEGGGEAMLDRISGFELVRDLGGGVLVLRRRP